MSTPDGLRVAQILAALDELGNATATEIAAYIGVDRNNVSRVISRMTKAQAQLPQRLRVVGWVRDADGEKTYPRAVYALGQGPNAPKPRTDPEERRRVWRRNRYGRLKGASVFNLGLGYHKLLERQKGMQ